MNILTSLRIFIGTLYNFCLAFIDELDKQLFI